VSRVGRPREHGPATREALLDAAEELLVAGGPNALSVRAAADAARTTTRAVYSVFGSKEGLLAGLAQRVFEVLGESLARCPVTEDPAQDLVDASVDVFRAMAIANPAAYRITFLRIVPDLDLGRGTAEASQHALGLLTQRFERLAAAGSLVGRTVSEATVEFNALCEGLATVELRNPRSLGDDPEAAWRRSIGTLVSGLAVAPSSGSGAPPTAGRGRRTSRARPAPPRHQSPPRRR
jgi:AcrR family transcriptional regulator